MILAPSRLGRPLRGAAPARSSALGIVMVLALLLPIGRAPAFVPTYAFVQEAEPIVFTLAPGTDDRWLDAIGTVEEGRLSLAFADRREGGVRLAFRLAGDEPRTIRSLLLGDPGGSFAEADLGLVTVVPAQILGGVPLRRRATAHFGRGPLLRGWRVVNETNDVQTVQSLAFAPPGVARPVVIARVVHAGDGGRDGDDLLAWLEALRGDLAERIPGGRHATPERVEAALRERLDATWLRDPQALDLTLAPGDAVDLVLTSASFALDLRAARILADPILSGVDAHGIRWSGSLSEPVRAGPWP